MGRNVVVSEEPLLEAVLTSIRTEPNSPLGKTMSPLVQTPSMITRPLQTHLPSLALSVVLIKISPSCDRMIRLQDESELLQPHHWETRLHRERIFDNAGQENDHRENDVVCGPVEDYVSRAEAHTSAA